LYDRAPLSFANKINADYPSIYEGVSVWRLLILELIHDAAEGRVRVRGAVLRVTNPSSPMRQAASNKSGPISPCSMEQALNVAT
jgi:hypothetical protein